MIQRYMEPAVNATTPADIAIDAIKEVGPYGHFFGCEHTQERYESAFYQPFISDWRNYEAWDIAGGEWTAQRAHNMFKEIVDTFEPPDMDVATKEELGAFVDRRKSEGGAPTDF